MIMRGLLMGINANRLHLRLLQRRQRYLHIAKSMDYTTNVENAPSMQAGVVGILDVRKATR